MNRSILLCSLVFFPDQSWDDPQILLVWHKTETEAWGNAGSMFLSAQVSQYWSFRIIYLPFKDSWRKRFPHSRGHTSMLNLYFIILPVSRRKAQWGHVNRTEIPSLFTEGKDPFGIYVDKTGMWIISNQYCCYQGKDSFGTYVNLHPRVANSIWMPDIFIDQVHPIIFQI